MAGSLYETLAWARANGDVDAMQRIRLQMLPMTVRERIVLDKVTPTTVCSAEYLKALRRAVRDVVGKEAP